MTKRKILLFVSLILFIVFLGISWYWYSANYGDVLPYFSEGRYAKTKQEVEKNNILPLPYFSFPNHLGDTTDTKFILSSVTIMNYFFTRCNDICPIMTRNIKTIQQAFKDDEDVKIISLSCDPKYDTPEKLKDYAKKYEVNPRQWSLVTGDKKTLYHFARKALQISVTEGKGDENDFIHSSYCALIDKNQYIRGYYDITNSSSIKQLIKDIKKLL